MEIRVFYKIKKVIASVVTDHDVLPEVGPYLVTFISSKSGCYWRGWNKRKKNNRGGEEEDKMGRKGDEKKHCQQAVGKTNKYLALSGGSSIQLFLQ